MKPVAFMLALGLSAGSGWTQRPPRSEDLTQVNLEDLMNIQVTSVSKREQKLARTAAAVFVITQDDIRRSGATNIPDLLRMAPGVNVEQIDANAWAISIRGFNSRYSNKVLVLIDGRTVYTPAFSGVFWEHLDLPLEDIDRIEVIRGPGATVWGANAVNGVISIFTKSARETMGGLASAGGGSQMKALGMLQYGAPAGAAGAWRVFGKYVNIGDSAAYRGASGEDHWQRMHGGFRSDWDLSDRDALLVEGDLFANQASQTRRSSFIATPFDRIFRQDLDAAGGNLLARWSHTLAGGSQTSFQTYYDQYRRTDMAVPEALRSFDLDFQHHLTAGDRHDVVWGAGYRVYNSTLSPGYAIALDPPSRTDSLYSAFLQDEIRLTRSVWLTLGSKLEHNAYTGFGIEPSARLVWAPTGGRHTVWAAASQAQRQPARVDAGIQAELERFPAGPNAVQVFHLSGNPDIRNETVRDYELGYRAEFTKTLSLDAATFLSFYRHLETTEPQPMVIIPGSPVEFQVPMRFENKARAVLYGGELSVNWNVAPRWRLSPGYAYLHATLRQDASSQGIVSYSLANGFPENMFQLRSSVSLPHKIEFDQSLYYTARLPGGQVAGHARLDLRLARRLGESTEISLVGQNLLRPRAVEYGDSYGIVGTQVVRSVYAKINWRF